MSSLQWAWLAPALVVVACIGHLLARRLFHGNPDPHPLHQPVENHLWVAAAVGLIGFSLWLMFS